MAEKIFEENIKDQDEKISGDNSRTVEKPKKKNLFQKIQERWLNLMTGKEKPDDFEPINFEEILPDIERNMGQRFELKPGKWWQTITSGNKKILNYPRKFGALPKNLSPEEKERMLKVQEGGILHEMGHHIGEVKTFQKFIEQADTKQRILGELSLGEAYSENLKRHIEKQFSSKRERESFMKMVEEEDLGPYLFNFVLLNDLKQIVLDVWNESFMEQYPGNKQFRREVKEAFNATNTEMCPEIPETLRVNETEGILRKTLLSSQFREAIWFKKVLRNRDDLWGGSGYDWWFKEGLFDEEVVSALKEVVKEGSLEELLNADELKWSVTPRERIKIVRDEKLRKGYFNLRKEYIKLLMKDFENMKNQKTEEFMKKEENSGKKSSSQGGSSQESKNEKEEEGKDELGTGKEGEDKKPEDFDFDDLPADLQEEIINDLLEQSEEESLGHPPSSEDDKKKNDFLKEAGKKAADGEIKRRKEEEERKKRKTEGEGKEEGKEGEEGKDKDEKSQESQESGEFESIKGKIRRDLATKERTAQLHAESELQKAESLGISIEQLKEFDEKKSELKGQIDFFEKGLVELFSSKLEAEIKKNQPMGKLSQGKLGEFLRKKARGEEARTFEYILPKITFPAVDLLFMVDHSGSMGILNKNEKAAEVVLLFSEAFRRAEEEINKKFPSSRKKRGYLREGLITFAGEAQLRKELNDDLSHKAIAQLYFDAKNISGGGTADAEGLKNTINYLRSEQRRHKGRCKVMNIVTVVTDGQGEREKVQEVLKTARDIKNTMFVVVGAGSDTEDVIDTWQKDMPNVKVVAVHVPDNEIGDMPGKIIEEVKRPLKNNFNNL